MPSLTKEEPGCNVILRRITATLRIMTRQDMTQGCRPGKSGRLHGSNLNDGDFFGFRFLTITLRENEIYQIPIET